MGNFPAILGVKNTLFYYMIMMFVLCKLSWSFIVLTLLSNYPQIDMSLHMDTVS
jgi:hypothetical protein